MVQKIRLYQAYIRRNHGGSKMRQANFVICFVSLLDFQSAANVGFTTPNIISKDPLILGLQIRNSLGIQDAVGDAKLRKA